MAWSIAAQAGDFSARGLRAISVEDPALSVAQILIVENPASRKGRASAAAVKRYLDSTSRPWRDPRLVSWVPVSRLLETEPPGARIVAVGGDGTVNSVAAWMITHGVRCPLGIVPAGTGNNLAGGLGLPRDIREACTVAFESKWTTAVDAVTYSAGGGERRVFVQSAGLGFPAAVAQRYDALRRSRVFRLAAGPLGTRVYTLLALFGLAAERWRDLRGKPPLHVHTEIDGERLDVDALAVFLGNEPTLGGNFVPCPRAQVDDGRVDVCFLRAGTGRSYLRLLARVKRGRHLELEDCVVYRQTARPFELHLSRPCSFLADGDSWLQSDHYAIEVAPASLSVTVGRRDLREPGHAHRGIHR